MQKVTLKEFKQEMRDYFEFVVDKEEGKLLEAGFQL